MQQGADNLSLRKQGAWLVLAKGVGFALSFILPLLVVRFLTQDDVGHYRETFQVITNAVIILPLGVSMSAYYFLARETTRRGAAILNILIFNFFAGGLACLALFLFPEMLGGLFRSDELTRLAPTIGVVIWIWIFSTFLEIVALANQEARMATVFIILASFSKTLLMGAGVIAFATVDAFIYAAIIQGVIQTAILLYYLRSRFPGFWRQFHPAFFREQMVYALPYGLAGVLYIAQNDIHNYFVMYKFTPAEFAIYAYGCFEVPLIAMLSESVTSVLMPRMNALQQAGERQEMIRLLARSMEKLAFFCFPLYLFLLITSHTFIVTLFTQEFEASTAIFIINLTLLPTCIFVNDPVIRSFREFGRIFLVARIVILTSLVGFLYFRLDSLGLTGMIAAAVGAILAERITALVMVIWKLGIGLEHLRQFANLVKIAAVSVFAGLITYVVYVKAHDYVLSVGEHFAEQAFHTERLGTLNFVGGSLVLAMSAAVFLPIYLIGANLLGLIEPNEKMAVKNSLRRILPRRDAAALSGSEG